MLVGLIIFMAWTMLINYLLAMLFKLGRLQGFISILNIDFEKMIKFGSMAPIFWILFTGIAIVRFKAMEISTVIHKTIGWLVASSLIILPIYGVYYLVHDYLIKWNLLELTFFTFGLFYLFTLYYQYVKPYIDQYFQKRKYNYKEELEKMNKQFSKNIGHGSIDN